MIHPNFLKDYGDLWENSVKKNQQAIERRIKINVEYKILTQDQHSKLFGNGKVALGWGEFYKQYPSADGIITFGRVGFNVNHTKALVYFEHDCEFLCGSNSYIILEKEGSNWKIIKRISLGEN